MKSIGLFLGIDPNAGGMFQYAQSLLEALNETKKSGCRVEVAYAAPAWESVLQQYPFQKTRLTGGKIGLLMANGFMALLLPGPFTRFLTGLINPISRQLVKLNCDAWIFPAQDALGYQVKLSVIAAIHDLMHRYEDFPELSGWKHYVFREHRFRNIASWARCILVDSEIGRQQVVESYGTDPAKIYPLPYTPPPYIYRTEERPDFEAHYNLPKKFIFYPAQFWQHKNHKRLLMAAAEAIQVYPDLHLVFSGSKRHEYENLYALASALGLQNHITFVGYVPNEDLPGFYRRARAMIMPTFLGPTNIPPLEAFVTGCPAAVSDIYGMPEQAGGAALLFNPKSADEISKTLQRLWQDDALCADLMQKGLARGAACSQKQFNSTFQKILAECCRTA